MGESASNAAAGERLPNLMTSFVNGAKKGTNLVIQVVIPNVVFSLTFMKLLTLSGIIDVIGILFSPVMGIFGLPGAMAMPLILSFASFSGALVSTAALAAEGIVTGDQVFMVVPFIFLVGSTIAMYTGRVLGVAGIALKDYKICYLTVGITATMSLFVMRIILTFL